METDRYLHPCPRVVRKYIGLFVQRYFKNGRPEIVTQASLRYKKLNQQVQLPKDYSEAS